MSSPKQEKTVEVILVREKPKTSDENNAKLSSASSGSAITEQHTSVQSVSAPATTSAPNFASVVPVTTPSMSATTTSSLAASCALFGSSAQNLSMSSALPSPRSAFTAVVQEQAKTSPAKQEQPKMTRTEEISRGFSESNKVTVRIWTSWFNVRTPGADVGHISVATKDCYMSLWPLDDSAVHADKQGIFGSFPGYLVSSYIEDMLKEGVEGGGESKNDQKVTKTEEKAEEQLKTYELCKMSGEEKEEKPEVGKIYLRKVNDELRYTVIKPDNVPITASIRINELTDSKYARLRLAFAEVDANNLLEKLKPVFPQILTIMSKQSHIRKVREANYTFNFYRLKTNKIESKFKRLQEAKIDWALLGMNKNSASCASMAATLLVAGEIDEYVGGLSRSLVSSSGSSHGTVASTVEPVVSSTHLVSSNTTDSKMASNKSLGGSSYSVELFAFGLGIKSPDALAEYLKKAKEKELENPSTNLPTDDGWKPEQETKCCCML